MVQFVITPVEQQDEFEQVISNFTCMEPFRFIEIHRNGNISACCYSWLPVWFGNLLTDSVDELLNNADRQLLQENAKIGKYKHCKDVCPNMQSMFYSRHNPPAQTFSFVPKKYFDHNEEGSQVKVSFTYDVSCNLQCPSCRSELIHWNKDSEQGKQNIVIHQKVKLLIDKLLTIHSKVILNITGSGDPFANSLYWEYLEELASKPVPKNLFFQIQTNGTLMTEEKLNRIRPLWPNILGLGVSIDAVTEDTYKVVRKNGNFKKLCQNLLTLDSLVFEGNFPSMYKWNSVFVLQKDNFRELKQFVEWQLVFKSKPIIYVSLVMQWGHLSDATYNEMALWRDGHENRSELITILKDPIFTHKRVMLGNVSSLLTE